MPCDAVGGGDAPRALELGLVSLAVAEGQGVDLEARVLGDGERRRGIDAARQEHDRFRSPWHGGPPELVALHSMIERP